MNTDSRQVDFVFIFRVFPFYITELKLQKSSPTEAAFIGKIPFFHNFDWFFTK